MTPLAPLARTLKQCQTCLKSESEVTPLQSCSRCKRAHYCSRECQTADWKNHKPRCQKQQEMRTEMKGDPVTSNPALDGLSKADVEVVTKKWVQQYRPLLSNIVFHALEIRSKLDQCLTHVLVVVLSPTFTTQNIPRKDVEIRHAFKPIDIYTPTIEEVIRSASDAMRPNLEENFASIIAKTKALREVDPAAVGYAVMLLMVPDCRLIRAVPLGADMRHTELPIWDPLWKKTFETCLAQGYVF